MSLRSRTLLLATAALTALSISAPVRAEEGAGQQLFPLFSYRTGPYAPSGIPQWAGYRDYFTYLNANGGVNGVKILIQECETAYTIERAFECYERYKNGYAGAPTAVIFTTSSGFDAAVSEKVREDRLPFVAVAGGRTDAVDGTVFPYQFPLLFDYWTEASIVVQQIANELGGYDKLKGQKIATLYHDSGYGRETIEAMRILSEKYGFEDIQIPVPHPGEQQQAQWQQIKRQGVDWVFFRAWGVMSPVGLKTAARVGFPAERIIGDIWTGSEEDARPAGAAAKGYKAVSVFPAGSDFEISRKLKAEVLDKGQGDLKDPSKFGSVYYNAGLVQAILFTEILRTGQEKFGNRPLTKEEGHWALENFNLTAERIAEIGATGLISPIKITATDHEGDPAAKIVQWDGEKWVVLTDWLKGDRALFKAPIAAKAAAYAKEKNLPPRDIAAN